MRRIITHPRSDLRVTRGPRNATPLAFVVLLLGAGLAIAGAGLASRPARAFADSSPNPALDTAFAGNLQVTLANTNGCPLTTALAGVPVTFSAPSSGASGEFAASGSNTLTVGTDASGMAAAAMYGANGIAVLRKP